MFPPKIAWMPAPKFPMIERDRTMMPRTTPKDVATRKPGSSNVVVVNGCVRFIGQRLNTTARTGKREKFGARTVSVRSTFVRESTDLIFKGVSNCLKWQGKNRDFLRGG